MATTSQQPELPETSRVPDEHQRTARLALIVAPGLPQEIASSLRQELERRLRRRYENVTWEVIIDVKTLIDAPVPIDQLVDAVRSELVEQQWDLAICLTELPIQRETQPVTTLSSPAHSIGLLSLPALGPQMQRKVLGRLFALVAQLLRSPTGDGESQHVLEALADGGSDQGTNAISSVHSIYRNARFLGGMLRANRPWRFAARLYRALAAALATTVFALVYSDMWRLASAAGPWRLTALSTVTIVAPVLALITAHGLWERSKHPGTQRQVLLLNTVTATTVLIGVATMYAALFLLALGGGLLLMHPDYLSQALGYPATAKNYLELAWLVSSLATVGGALVAGLESNEAVRRAAYAYEAT